MTSSGSTARRPSSPRRARRIRQAGTEVGDAADLPLPDASADLVTAFMSLQDVDDLDRALREIARALVAGGHLRSAIVHPIGSAGDFRRGRR